MRLTIRRISVLYSILPFLNRSSTLEQKGRNHLKSSKLISAGLLAQALTVAVGLQPLLVPVAATAKCSAEMRQAPPEVTEENINGKSFCVCKIVVNAKQEQVWRILTDYNSAGRVFPQLKKSKLIEDRGDVKIIDQEVAPSGVCATYDYQLEVKEAFPQKLEWHRLKGDFKQVDGYWKLEPLEDGHSTLVTYSTYVNAGLFPPQMLIKHQFHIDMPSILTHLKNESEAAGLRIARRPDAVKTE